MDVRLSPEQRALRDSAAQVVDRLGPHAVGQLDDRERVAKLDAAVAAAGWRELRAAASDDGTPWASGVEVGLVAEELGRGLADTPYLGPTLAAELRRLAGAPPAPSPETVALTPDLSSLALALAVDGTSTGTDGSDRAGHADRAEGAGVMRAVAVDVHGARSALVLVPVAGGYVLGRVELSGLDRAEGGGGVDLTRPTVALAALPSPPATSGGAGGAVVPVAGQSRVLGDDDIVRWTALGLALTSADLVGTMQGAVQLATDYARERRQYGRPVGSFQAVQHMLADALVSTEGSRSAALHAAWAVDARAPDDALAAAAAAKAYCARAARAVCETAIQVHGGIGHTWECLAHVHLRRALLSSDVLGGVGPSLARVLHHHGIGRGVGHQRRQGNSPGASRERGERHGLR